MWRFAIVGAYNGGMQRIAGLSALLLCASVATAGCGGSHVRLSAFDAAGAARPPLWLMRIAGREERVLNDRDPRGGTSYTLSKQKDVIVMFGEFATPPAVCTTSYCPAPVSMHGTSLRLVISPRTHRLLLVKLSQRIAGNQAPAIARRSSRFLRIFPARPGRALCSIPSGATQLQYPRGVSTAANQSITKTTLRGRCKTQFVMSPPLSRKTIRVRFGERWHLGGHAQRAAWIVTVRLRDGRVRSTQVLGQPPQLWK